MVGSATRADGPGTRPWEYALLDAISKDSPDLVDVAVRQHSSDIDWNEKVAEHYGRNRPNEVHYLISSFGLDWRIGQTLVDTAKLNAKCKAAEAIAAASQGSTAKETPLQVSEDHVQVALIQCASEIGEIKKNMARLEKRIRTAAEQGAKLVILPETAVTGYLSQDLQTNWGLPGRPQSYPKTMHPVEFAESRNGSSVTQMAELAQSLGIFITVPYLESDGVDFYNSIALVGPDSSREKPVLAHYRKNCPWPHPEKSWATPGSGISEATYDTPYGRIGLAICFDIHSILAKYADSGLWALLYPIAWVGDTDRWFLEELPNRLKTVNCPHYILGANWATIAPQAWSGAGRSSAYGPGGCLLANAEETRFRGCEEIVMVTIPTQKKMPQIGPLDLARYELWTKEQIGTDYWVPRQSGEP